MYRLKQLILIAGDFILLWAGLYAALWARYWHLPSGRELDVVAPMASLFGGAIVLLFIVGAYDLGRAKNSRVFFQKIIIAGGLWVLLGIIYFYLKPGNLLTPKTILLLTAAFGFGLIALWRFIHNRFLSSMLLKTNVIFVGLTPEAHEIISLLISEPQRGFAPVGLVDSNPSAVLPAPLASLPRARTLPELFGQAPSAHLFVIAPELTADVTLLQALYRELFRQTEVIDLASFYETTMGRIPPFTFSEIWFLTNLREQSKKMYDRLRILVDYASALLMGALFAATLPLIATAIAVTSRGPVFFKQKRIGRAGRPFTIYKYRTMRSLCADGSAEVAGPQFAAEGDRRVTATGRLLRRSRLDELPQFINILRGDMGIIGPRPERPEFAAELTAKMPFYSLRHLVKPGLTGWAQLHESYYGTIDENLRKLEYDLYYLKNRGPILDITILLKTLAVIARLGGR